MNQRVFKTAYFVYSERAAPVDPDEPMQFVASTEIVDRYGDIVRADGWELGNFKSNPIALFNHSSNAIVGTAKAWLEGKRLLSTVKLAAAGTGPIVDYVRSLVVQRILRAVSVGFLPLEPPTMLRDEKNERITGFEFTKQELLEISLVGVPANPQAVLLAKSLNLSDDELKFVFVPEERVKTYSPARARLELEKMRGAYANK